MLLESNTTFKLRNYRGKTDLLFIGGQVNVARFISTKTWPTLCKRVTQ